MTSRSALCMVATVARILAFCSGQREVQHNGVASTIRGKSGVCMEGEGGGEKRRQKLGGEASWSHDTHPNSRLAVQAGGSL